MIYRRKAQCAFCRKPAVVRYEWKGNFSTGFGRKFYCGSMGACEEHRNCKAFVATPDFYPEAKLVEVNRETGKN
jgi:hypothetical protein